MGLRSSQVDNLIAHLLLNKKNLAKNSSISICRVLGGAGGEGAFVLAFTMSLEYSGVAERVPGLPWVTYSTFLANMISGSFTCCCCFCVLLVMVFCCFVLFCWVASAVFHTTYTLLAQTMDSNTNSNEYSERVGSELQKSFHALLESDCQAFHLLWVRFCRQ